MNEKDHNAGLAEGVNDTTVVPAATATARHTPGPWVYDGTDRWSVDLPCAGHPIRVGRRSNGREILVEGWSAEEAVANARLIAAAPEMYDALNRIAYEPFGRSEATDREVLESITIFARQVIAKAEGRS